MLQSALLQPRRESRRLRSAITTSAFLLAVLVPLRASHAQEATSLRYVRAKEAGAKLFNLADKTSIVLASVPSQGLMEVYAENSGYLSVDVPGGMPVWVYGQYLHTTSVPGIVEVTGNGVFMRPLPKSDESSYPLQQQLHKGDRLRVLGRNDATKALSDDWIQVASPAGTRAWVVAADTTNVDAKEDVRAAWSEAVKSANAARPTFDLSTGKAATLASETKTAANTTAANTSAANTSADGTRSVAWAGAPNGSPSGAPGAAAAGDPTLESADGLYEAARASSTPDWVGVRSAYQRYLEKHSEGPLAERARLQLQRVELHEEIQRIQNDRSVMESTRGERLTAAQRRLAEANQSQDPLWGRFQARGWIVREQPVAAAAPRFVVFWAGRPTAEIVCSSGRYDLSKFTDFEVGITGAVLRPGVSGSDSSGARPARIDVTRLEVLGARIAK